MHEGEVRTDAALVGRLLASQFPHWARLPISPVASAGTDNALYRLGDDLVARLPRFDWAVGQAEKEQRWLPLLAPHLPLAIPEPLALGVPDGDFPWPWSVHRWLASGSDHPRALRHSPVADRLRRWPCTWPPQLVARCASRHA